MSARASATGRIPVTELLAESFGPLGVTVGELADAGGCGGAGLHVLPMVTVTWFDERQVCEDVLAFVHHGDAPDLQGCAQYNGGECLLVPGRVCAFLEDESADVWDKARDWRLIDGCAVHRELWASYGVTP